jgi:hypothetical protein
MMAAHDVNLADADAEMVCHELADGNIGLVVDWGGDDADHETASSIPAHVVSASARDHSYLETLVLYAHEPDPMYPLASQASAGRQRSPASGQASGRRHR